MSVIQEYITHSDQQLYRFDRIDDDGLAWWRCVYCGTGDEIASAMPRRSLALDEVGGAALEESENVVIVDDNTDQPQPTPEPGTAALLALALCVYFVVSRLYRGRPVNRTS